MNHMLHGAVARIGGAIKRIEGADGAKYSLTVRNLKKTICRRIQYLTNAMQTHIVNFINC